MLVHFPSEALPLTTQPGFTPGEVLEGREGRSEDALMKCEGK
jgi:hypothetical protein